MTTALYRQELEDLLRGDLLGPAAGPQETVTEANLRQRYLLGMLAPARTRIEDDDPQEELADDSEEGAEEGVAEPSTPAPRGILPATFGFSFCLELEETEFHAEAAWGRYLRGRDSADKLIWVREPRGGGRDIPLREGPLRGWAPDPECPRVLLRGRIRRRATHWSVTLFLANEQEEGTPRDASWLFQAELTVRGRFIQTPGQGRVSTLDAVSRLEDRLNEMLYRGQFEFARGHGISVAWDLDESRPGRALLIRTAALPRAIVPAIEQRRIEGLEVDMRELADSSDEALLAMLRPLERDYAAWIEELDARRAVESDLADYADVSGSVTERARDVLRRLAEALTLLASNADSRAAFRFANRAMAAQRVRSVWLERKKSAPALTLEEVDVPANRSWRAFQLAFILINLPGLTSLDHPDRDVSSFAGADLLWFPTGGGKTEAYLGLAAYILAMRRLQPGLGGRDGENGRRGADALHLAAADTATVPARCDADLRLRTDPPGRPGTLGPDPVPPGPVGGPQDHPEPHRSGGRGGGGLAQWTTPGDGRWFATSVSVLPLVRQADFARARHHRGKVSGRARAHAHPLRRPAGRVRILAPALAIRGSAPAGGGRRTLPPAAVDADCHGRQVRPDGLAGAGADALRPCDGRVPAPRLPLAGAGGHQITPGRRRFPRHRKPAPQPVAPGGPDHPGRVAPDQRPAGQPGGHLRGGPSTSSRLGR